MSYSWYTSLGALICYAAKEPTGRSNRGSRAATCLTLVAGPKKVRQTMPRSKFRKSPTGNYLVYLQGRGNALDFRIRMQLCTRTRSKSDRSTSEGHCRHATQASAAYCRASILINLLVQHSSYSYSLRYLKNGMRVSLNKAPKNRPQHTMTMILTKWTPKQAPLFFHPSPVLVL